MIANINLTHLKYFFDAATHGSVSAAARENYVSQSAISQGISRLEQALQVTLTTHQRQSFKLTEEGRIVYEESKRLFVAVDGLKDRLSALKGEIAGNVKFACTNSLAQFYIPSAYLTMRDQYPKVRLKFHRGSLQFIHEALREGKVNFALALDAAEFEGYDREIIARGSFRLFKLKGMKKNAGVFIDHAENAEVIEFRQRYRERYGKDLEIRDALSGWAMVSTFIQMGCGAGYLPEFIVKGHKDIQEVELDIVPLQYAICMVKPKGTVLTRAEIAFLKILKEKK